MDFAIPSIDIAPLLAGDSADRDRVDELIIRAAQTAGFFVASGIPPGLKTDQASRRELLRIFALPESEQRALWRRKFSPDSPNVYRGWFPLQYGHLTSKEGIDMGPDLAYGDSVVRQDDPLCEPTPLPREASLPGWRLAAKEYYLSMLRISQALMRSLARSLGLEERFFDAAFERGISTLRLIRYPLRTDAAQVAERRPDIWAMHDGQQRPITGAPHVDSGLLTLLAQDGVPGLQARELGGAWLDVSPMPDCLAVNFGKVLERWSLGRIKATEHRVLGGPEPRMSIPFFYEARVDAEISPLPIDPPGAFEPFLYGDHLWEATTNFVEFAGLKSLRVPRRVNSKAST
jgi:isopenicillin N synthase-like dioxygenase